MSMFVAISIVLTILKCDVRAWARLSHLGGADAVPCRPKTSTTKLHLRPLVLLTSANSSLEQVWLTD